MSNNQFDRNLLRFDASIFAPMLKEDIREQPPPFTTTHPLTSVNFSAHPEDDLFLTDLNDVLETLTAGFGNDDASLNCDQWIQASAQLTAGINTGLHKSYPYNNSQYFFSNLGPSECKGLESLTMALGSLDYFLSQPPSDEEATWRQCARCLAVGGTKVTAEHLEALLQTCRQDTAAARQSLLNSEIAEF